MSLAKQSTAEYLNDSHNRRTKHEHSSKPRNTAKQPELELLCHSLNIATVLDLKSRPTTYRFWPANPEFAGKVSASQSGALQLHIPLFLLSRRDFGQMLGLDQRIGNKELMLVEVCVNPSVVLNQEPWRAK